MHSTPHYQNYDYRQWPRLSVRNWEQHELNLIKRHIYAALQEVTYMPNTSEDRPRISRTQTQENKHLFKLIAIAGFFEFHQSNNGYTCYVSQVMAYINGNKKKGGIWKYIKGQVCNIGELEVHHNDENPTNNNCSNLEYVSPDINKFLHHFIRKCKQNITSGITILNNTPPHIKCLAQKTLNACINKFKYQLNLI